MTINPEGDQIFGLTYPTAISLFMTSHLRNFPIWERLTTKKFIMDLNGIGELFQERLSVMIQARFS